MWGLLGLGALSEAIYLGLTLAFPLPRYYGTIPPLDLGKLTGYQPSACLAFVNLTLALFAAYGIALWLTRGVAWERGWKLVFALAAIFGLTLAFLYPVTAIDIFLYALQGRVLTVHGANPMRVPPAHFPEDPFLGLAGQWRDLTTPYGPLWVMVAALPSWLAGDHLLAHLLGLKALAVAFYLGSAGLVAAILARIAPRHRLEGTLFFAWNPLVVLETAGNGHNDVTMIFFLLLGIFLLVRGRRGLVIPALVASALTKYVPLLLIPPFLGYLTGRIPTWRERWAFLGRTVAGAALLGLALFAPLWPGWRHLRLGNISEGASFSLPALGIVTLRESALLDPGVAFRAAMWAGFAAFGAVYLWFLVRHAWGQGEILAASFETLFWYLILATLQFRTWYLTWLAALAPFVTARGAWRRTAIFCLTAQLSVAIYGYLWVWHWRAWTLLRMYLIAVPFVFGPPLLATLWAYRRSEKGIEGGSKRPFEKQLLQRSSRPSDAPLFRLRRGADAPQEQEEKRQTGLRKATATKGRPRPV